MQKENKYFTTQNYKFNKHRILKTTQHTLANI